MTFISKIDYSHSTFLINSKRQTFSSYLIGLISKITLFIFRNIALIFFKKSYERNYYNLTGHLFSKKEASEEKLSIYRLFSLIDEAPPNLKEIQSTVAQLKKSSFQNLMCILSEALSFARKKQAAIALQIYLLHELNKIKNDETQNKSFVSSIAIPFSTWWKIGIIGLGIIAMGGISWYLGAKTGLWKHLFAYFQDSSIPSTQGPLPIDRLIQNGPRLNYNPALTYLSHDQHSSNNAFSLKSGIRKNLPNTTWPTCTAATDPRTDGFKNMLALFSMPALPEFLSNMKPTFPNPVPRISSFPNISALFSMPILPEFLSSMKKTFIAGVAVIGALGTSTVILLKRIGRINLPIITIIPDSVSPSLLSILTERIESSDGILNTPTKTKPPKLAEHLNKQIIELATQRDQMERHTGIIEALINNIEKKPQFSRRKFGALKWILKSKCSYLIKMGFFIFFRPQGYDNPGKITLDLRLTRSLLTLNVHAIQSPELLCILYEKLKAALQINNRELWKVNFCITKIKAYCKEHLLPNSTDESAVGRKLDFDDDENDTLE